MNALAIAGIGVCAPGMPEWAQARAVLRGDAEFRPQPLGKLDIPALPVTERRRVNATSRLAIHAAMQAVDHLPVDARAGLASVFASADGDGEVLANTLAALAQDAVAMSPTLFHNSVFNAPAGYWTIASRASPSSITVSAGSATFAAGLLEAGVEVAATGAPVLYVAFDMPFPASLRAFAVTGDSFACALLLAPAATTEAAPWGTIARWDGSATADAPHESPAALNAHFAGNAAAAALPLLRSIARQQAGAIALPYLDGPALAIAYTP